MMEIIERFSSHFSSREGQPVKYIIVHSTASASVGPPENTLNYLAHNDRQVSVHELVLLDGKVYRMVRDELAAHHCESASVRFPDGTAPDLANEVTWGIELYQIAGRDTSDGVIYTGIDRVVEACRRFDLRAEAVLGHREIDPSRRSDPVGVDMDWFRGQVKKALVFENVDDGLAIALRKIVGFRQINIFPNAALFRAIMKDEYIPVTNELEVTFREESYIAQLADNPLTGETRVYYTRYGDWQNVRYGEA